jgi:uncharacterized membrane protein YeaQ/YmgE (transglycosylase-associated protein family)
MSFAMFAGWVLAGLLAGLMAGLVMKHGGYGLKGDVYLALAGSIGGSWILRIVGAAPNNVSAGAVIAFIFAAVLIGAQRKFRPIEPAREERVTLWRWGLGASIVAGILWMALSPNVPPVATAAAVQDKTYTVTPSSTKVQTGIVAAELTDMKVTERVEDGSGRIVTPAKLTGRLVLTNTSRDQAVRLVSGKLRYIDGTGRPIKLEDTRTEPTIKFSASGTERLDPGQEATESLDVDFPVSALTGSTLKAIYMDLVYIPSAYREASARFGVAIGAK